MQRLVDKIGIDHRRAIANQAGNVVRVARHTRLNNDIRVASQTGLHKVVVHSTGREQRMHRQLALFEIAIAEHHDQLAVAHGLFGHGADLVERFGQTQSLRRHSDR